MRPVLWVAALTMGSAPALAQSRSPDSTKQVTPPPAARGVEQADTQLTRLRNESRQVPDADKFSVGNRTVPAGTTVDGPIAVTKGTLDVFGTVLGSVFALGGDVRVHRGARITGDALAAGGQVIVDGGVIEGARRSLRGSGYSATDRPARAPLTTWESAKLTIGWFAVLVIIGLGVMVFGEGNLDGVVIALERGFARSFWIGVAGQLMLLPALLLLVAALVISVLGVLLIPFAIVSYVIAAAGLMTLGFLAVARLTGGALTSDEGTTSPRGVHVRALFTGLVVYLGLWLLAAVFTWSPVAGGIFRAVAISVTWVAATVGLGAALASRAGTQRPGASKGAAARATEDSLAWQTPTPVSGVAAARRPATPSARER